MNVNLELYRVFYVVASTGSISKAAKELFTSQPAVSQSIKVLEHKLGGQLFIRTPKGVKLTVEGDVLFKYIEQGYSFFKTAEQKFLEMQNLQAGQLRIGVSDTLCKYYLISYLEKYTAAYPEIKIHVTNQTTFEIIDLLKGGKIDLGVINLPIKDDCSLELTQTLKIQDCFIVGKKFKHLSGLPISLKKLVEYPMVLLEKDSNSRNFIDNYAEANGIKLVPEIELGTVDLLVEFAKKGLGISCVIKDFIKEELASEEIFEVTVQEKIPQRTIGVAQLKGTPVSTAVKKFIEVLIN
ncbi:LysR family transcriptional regulator [Pelosinus propionicus]|uniref:DNA-binding transcriptional regulator, LysR family n=1 Tax=Pelosinus propionicus DSM 13327 TaxID=1123291 RepID=A0A1I4QJC6_9FIRM|nr:LysR family transcriptional regulator [Pelosinus propionicus]SFM39805.1 DNA-binding transcriptional regulator, LysR family [Pelosinus propionicus DSM 13327]